MIMRKQVNDKLTHTINAETEIQINYWKRKGYREVQK